MDRYVALWRQTALASYLSLIVMILLWESWGAPSRQVSIYFGLIVKTAPLLIPLKGVVQGHIGAHMGASLLMLLYFTEGVVLSYSGRFESWQWHSELVYAVAETALSTIFIVSAGLYIRSTNLRRRTARGEPEARG